MTDLMIAVSNIDDIHQRTLSKHILELETITHVKVDEFCITLKQLFLVVFCLTTVVW